MNNLKVGKGKSSIAKKKNHRKSRPRIHECRCRPATAKVKSSETSRDLNGYLEPLTHLCTVFNIANESCIRSQEITLA